MTTPPLSELPSQYDHSTAQLKWYPFWEENGYFHADPTSEKPPFTIVIPPPNVTGALHLGHALNNTLQDILCRMKRMQGFNVLWMPGTDHAGIATQARVEKWIHEHEGKSRHDLGREGLVSRIWEWKEEYEQRIIAQLKSMGFSCDWQRTRFTLDEQCARAVRETFFKLFQDGNIYRGKRLVNWDTYLQTAVSDDEVFHEQVKGHFWHFSYPVIDPKSGEPTSVTIATTRPETMLGDTAVAVHPDPEKALAKTQAELEEKLAAAPEKEKSDIEIQLEALAHRREFVLPVLLQLRDMANRGVKLQLPLTEREIPLITDEWAKPELGSGCVKITPAHDANDYEVWQRHQEIGAINILNTDGTLNENVLEKYRGLSMKKARKEVVADLANLGFHDPEQGVEDREIDLAHSDRSKTPIEPYLADQWFVKMDKLAQSAIDAVADGRVKITPDRYAKGYLDWLSEKRDWPIGRQLWWGHRIPVWRFQLSQIASYQEQGGSLQNALSKAYSEFTQALGQFATDYNIEGDLVPSKEPETSGIVRVCAKTKVAAEKLEEFWSRHRYVSNFHIFESGDPLPATTRSSTLPETHPGYKSDKRLKELVRSIGQDVDPQETDVLDTWFSSALWPHSTLGWPDETDELKAFYPTSTLITSRDIITLWVARMVLTGLHNRDDVPFKEVYIHPKILDGYGETMSKSKGNGVDPLDVIEQFGADALRFGLAYLTTETQDVRMPVEFVCPHCGAAFKQTKKNRVLPRVECEKCGEPFGTQWAQTDEDKALPRGAVTSERFELGRNFCNKLWNASRFALMNLEGYVAAPVTDEQLLLEDRWLLSRLATVTSEVTTALGEYRYADAARELYSFAWDDFCSFYVEITKARFAVAEQRAVAQRVLAHALDTLLRLLHPMVPFLTEEVWQLLGSVASERGLASPVTAAESICVAPWPNKELSYSLDSSADIKNQFSLFQNILGDLRDARAKQGIPNKAEIKFLIQCDDDTASLLKPMEAYFRQMAQARCVGLGKDVTRPDRSIAFFYRSTGASTDSMDVYVDMSDFFDPAAEKKRLSDERDNLAKFVKTINSKLSNENFVSRAPADVVQAERDKLAEVEEKLAAVEVALGKL